jgi:hypothetical protein
VNSPKPKRDYSHLFRPLTPTERVRMTSAMSAFARDCVRFALRKKYAALSDVEIEQFLLLRMYGKEVHPKTMEIALRRIAERGVNRSTR